MLERALGINEKVFGPVHPTVASTLISSATSRFVRAGTARRKPISRACWKSTAPAITASTI